MSNRGSFKRPSARRLARAVRAHSRVVRWRDGASEPRGKKKIRAAKIRRSYVCAPKLSPHLTFVISECIRVGFVVLRT